MNDDLEQRLARLRPADLPQDLQARLAEPARKTARWLPLMVTLGVAVGCVLLFFSRVSLKPVEEVPASFSQEGPSDFRVFLPVSNKSTLVSLEDIAVISPDPAVPVRLMRATWLDDITYRGDDGRSTFRREEPRAEIIPVMLETY